jgi:ferredoxin--NADP+ reductase
MHEQRTLRVAIVGAGPAGIYAADFIHRRQEVLDGSVSTTIDLLDRDMTPFGLIRYGVAPDHPRIKGISNALHKILDRGDVRFWGNIDVGVDVSLSTLKQHYDAVILATGATRDRQLEIPGVPAELLHGAADFISWYDGHPDGRRDWPLTAHNVAVIGNGNVALDVARVLGKPATTMLDTDIPANVYRGLQHAETRDVHIFGRRGPSDVKFTPLELRELGEQRDLDVVVDPADLVNAPAGQSNQARAMHETFLEWLAREPRHGARRVHFHFFHTPTSATYVDQGIRTLSFDVRRPARPLARASYSVEAVYHAVGYESTPVAGAPWDSMSKTVPHIQGRVVGSDGMPIAGLYATGWIKRGPVGLIGHTKSDAKETVASLFDDLESSSHSTQTAADADLRFVLPQLALTTWDDWIALASHEQMLGQTFVSEDGPHARDRVKVVERAEMRAASRGAE